MEYLLYCTKPSWEVCLREIGEHTQTRMLPIIAMHPCLIRAENEMEAVGNYLRYLKDEGRV